MKLKKMWIVCAAVLLMVLMPIVSFAEARPATAAEMQEVRSTGKSKFEWENEGPTWKLLYLLRNKTQWAYAAGWVQIGDNFYYFDAEGNMKEGWFQDSKGTWYFAIPDNLMRTNPDAGRIVTGWAKVGDNGGQKHYFYFTKDESGRPTGMFASTSGENYANKEIDGQTYLFNALGYCQSTPADSSAVPVYNFTRGLV